MISIGNVDGDGKPDCVGNFRNNPIRGCTSKLIQFNWTMCRSSTRKYIPWNGSYNGLLAPVGDYYYVIESVVKKKKLTGTLTVKY